MEAEEDDLEWGLRYLVKEETLKIHELGPEQLPHDDALMPRRGG